MSYTFLNEGSQILKTDYFNSDSAKSGILYLSVHNGDLRLLVPDLLKGYLIRVKDAEDIEVSVFDNAVLFIFNDLSDAPFRMVVDSQRVDYFAEIQKDFASHFYIYVEEGLKFPPIDIKVKYEGGDVRQVINKP